VGLIAGEAVRCITPESQVKCHTGYELPEVQKCDMKLLYQKFGVLQLVGKEIQSSTSGG
jgi:hypothetical protein